MKNMNLSNHPEDVLKFLLEVYNKTQEPSVARLVELTRKHGIRKTFATSITHLGLVIKNGKTYKWSTSIKPTLMTANKLIEVNDSLIRMNYLQQKNEGKYTPANKVSVKPENNTVIKQKEISLLWGLFKFKVN